MIVDTLSDCIHVLTSMVTNIPDISYGLKNINLTATNPFLD